MSVALAFLSEAGLTAIRVEGLENRTRALAFHEGTVLRLEQLQEIIPGILREEYWCRLQGDYGSFVHFSWDYYMYVGVPHPCPLAERKAGELGLFVEEFISPCHC